MKRYYRILFFCLLAILQVHICEAQTSKSKKKKPTKKHVVKKKPIPVKLNRYSVSGTIEISNQYCGGDQPSPKILEEISTPKPFANKTVFIKKGNANSAKNPVITAITSNDSGKFNLVLTAGTYCIIQDFQVQPLQFEQYNKVVANQKYLGDDCMRKYWADCYLTFEVKEAIKDIKISFQKPCFGINNPCINYVGPMPP